MGAPFELLDIDIIYALAIGSFFLVSLIWASLCWRWTSINLPYPPGPPDKGLLSGNLRDIPVAQAWHTYMEWGKKYGDILHYRVYDKHTIILNSFEDNVELLEKRSGIYSDRPYMPMLELMGWVSYGTGLMPYGPKWRSHRRMYQQFLKAGTSSRFRPTQTRKTLDFLYGLLTTPDNFINHYRTLAAAIIMSTMYGYDVAPKEDYFVGLAERAINRLSASAPPDASLFFTFPILRYLPSWFPGTQFKQFALEGKKWAHEMRDVPLGFVQKQMKEETAPHCVSADLLETCQSKEEMDVIAGVVLTSYADTTVSLLGTFFLAMALFPDAQRRAKLEIDTVIGSERLIVHDDRPSLPYVEALYREAMRWRPVTPLSIFHACSSDDVYKGFYIPKGATVMSNIWAIAHDSKRYPDPDIFDPGRFLDENGELNNDDVGYAFGFGRRICPGRYMASATVWLAIATTLQNFDIQKTRNSKGDEIPISGEYCDGLISHPLPFECSITPRFMEARNMILEAVGKLP
ncbi:hypothetical protein HYPSUDRAFT_44792 [Hypholoma sublateritium FD-334 SS-4]|uniref:Cytochrome P450 n=1 Tax=Hypholoma sublateritium (strain FD-334 SS-4) TaxID=945553 RepID=A0A0D2PFN6_HYPSF|nr:hypothetical protein HYPSUDRAFT_44792 [Hypholoma sublateritium FD-334 SS-4]